MNWPVSQDYNEAVQNPATSFSDPDLKTGEVVLNALGLPVPRSGNFADVYEFKGGDGKKWALKCFTRKVAGLQERYAKIDEHLSKAQFPFTVGFKYMAEGIRIRGQWFPLLKMEWVEGFTLNEFIRDNADKKHYLHALMQMWGKLTALLRDGNFAHADLQHGNVLLVPATTGGKLGLRLIDYDGMWVPALAETHSGEVGHPNFQHPQRLKDRLYNAEVDRFPHLVIASALRATLLGGKELWNKFDNGDNLLFKESDLRDPAHAAIFKTLWNLHDDVLCTLVGKLALATQEPLRRTPWLDDLLLTDDGKRLTDSEETRVMTLLGVGPHFTAPKTTAAPAAGANEYDVFVFEEESAGPTSSKSGAHKLKPVKEEKKPKKKEVKEQKAKSKLPLYIGGGVAAVALIVGIIIAMSGGKKDPPSQPEVVKDEPPPKPKKKDIGESIVDESKKKKDAEVVVKNDGGGPTTPERVWKIATTAGYNRLLFNGDGSKIIHHPFKSSTLLTRDARDGANPSTHKLSVSDLFTMRLGPDDVIVATGPSGLMAIDPKDTKGRFGFAVADPFVSCPVARDLNAVLIPEKGGLIIVHSLADGNKIATHTINTGPNTGFKYVACSPDGKTVAAFTSGGNLFTKVGDDPNFKMVHSSADEKTADRRLSLSPDGKRIAVSSGADLRVLETATGKEQATFSGHSGLIKHVHFARDGRLLSIALDKTFRIWDADNGKQLHQVDLEGAGTSFDLSPDGQTVALATEKEDSLQLWRLPVAGKKDPVVIVKKDAGASPERVWKRDINAGFDRLVFSNNGSRLIRHPGGPDMFIVDATKALGTKHFNHTITKLESLRMGPGDVVVAVGSKRLVAIDLKTEQPRFSLDIDYSTIPCPVAWDMNAVMAPQVGGEINVFSLVDGNKIETHKLPDATATAHIRYLDCSADGKTIAAISAYGKLYTKTAADSNLKIIRQDRRVKEMPRRATLSADAKYVALWMQDEPIRVLETATGKEKSVLTGHGEEVKRMLFANDGRWLLSISLDKTFRIWDVETGKQLHQIDLEGEARAIDLSRDGKHVAVSTDTEGSTQLWRLPSAQAVVAKKDTVGGALAEPKELWKVEGPCYFNCLAFSSDGSQIYRSRGLDPRNIALHSVVDGALAPNLIGVPLGVASILTGPGQLLSLTTMTKTTKSKLLVFDLQTSMERWRVDIEAGLMHCPFASTINAVLVSEGPGKLSVLSAADGKNLQTYDLPPTAVIRSIDCSPDGKVVVASAVDGEIYAKTANQATLKSIFKVNAPSSRKVTLTPDFTRAAITFNSQIHLLDLSTGKIGRTLPGHTDTIRDVFFSPDGRYMVSTSNDKTFRTWDVAEGKQLHQIDLESPAKVIAISPDGGTVAISTVDNQLRAFRLPYSGGTPIAKKDPAAGDRGISELKRVWQNERSCASNALIGFSEDGSTIVMRMTKMATIDKLSAGDGSTIGAIDIGKDVTATNLRVCPNDVLMVRWAVDKTFHVATWDLKTGARQFDLAGTLRPIISWPDRAAKTQSIITTDRDTQVYTLADGKLIDTIKPTYTSHAEIFGVSLDEKYVAFVTGDGDLLVKQPNKPDWDKYHVQDKQTTFIRYGLSINERFIALATMENTIRIFETATGREIKKLEGHSAGLQFLQFTPNPNYLISASDDKTVRIWNIETGKEVQQHQLEGKAKAFAISRDGRSLCIPTSSPESVQLWRFDQAFEPEPSVGKKDPLIEKKVPPDATKGTTIAFRFKEHDWKTGDPVVRLIDQAKGFAVLTAVGGFFDGAGEQLTLQYRKDGLWFLRPQAVQRINCQAMDVEFVGLVPTTEVKEYQWNRGDPPIKMIAGTEGFCFLSGIGGRFLGGGESVGVHLDKDGYWYLTGDSAVPVAGKAISIRFVKKDTYQITAKEFTWNTGQQPVPMIKKNEGFCFVSKVRGGLRGGGEEAKVYLGGDDTWYLSGRTGQKNLTVAAYSISITR